MSVRPSVWKKGFWSSRADITLRSMPGFSPLSLLCLSFLFPVCTWTFTCVCTCVWWPEDNLNGHSQALPTLLFCDKVSYWPETHQASKPLSPRKLPVATSQTLGSYTLHHSRLLRYGLWSSSSGPPCKASTSPSELARHTPLSWLVLCSAGLLVYNCGGWFLCQLDTD